MIALDTPLQLQISGHTRRHKSTLIGKDHDHFLIVKAPATESREQFREETEIVIRYVYEGSIYGFKSQIILAIEEPIDVLFIKFPKEIEDYNLRSHKRFECHLPSRIQVRTRHQGRKLIFRGITNDLSKGGCRVLISQTELEWVNEPVKIQSNVELFLVLPGHQEELGFGGIVRNISQDQEGLALGIQFAELNPKSSAGLNKYLAVYQK